MKALWVSITARIGAVVVVLSWVVSASAQPFVQTYLSQEVIGAFDVTAADFDNDGDIDIAVTSRLSHSVFWVEARNDSPSITHSIWVGGLDGPCGLTSGDFDSDGDADIVVATYDENRFVLLENNGGSGGDRFTERTLLNNTNGAWSVSAGDIDSDGDLDLVTTEYRGNTVRWLRNDGGQFTQVSAASIREPMEAFFADFDGDSDQDIIVASYSVASIWLEQTSDGWSRHTLSFGDSTSDLDVGDLDMDGDLDVVTCKFRNEQVMWWEHSGSQWIQHSLSSVIEQPRDVRIMDMNQDGRPDILAAGQAGDLVWWVNGGNRVFTAQSLPRGAGLYGMDILDIDWDSDPDIVVADYNASAVSLYRNTMGIPSYLSGYIRAASDGSGIAGAAIRLIEIGATAYSGADGRYRLPATVGDYTVTISHPCWNPIQMDSVHLARAETTFVDTELRRGVIDVDVTSLNLLVQNKVATQTHMTIGNTGDGVLTIQAETQGQYANDDWLTIEPPSVELASQEETTFTITIQPDTSNDGTWDYFGQIILHNNSCPDSAIAIAVLVAVLDAPSVSPAIPVQTYLYPAYPNPFNATTILRYELAVPSAVSLTLYDILGREVQELAEGMTVAGKHQISIAADHLPSGVYMVRMTTDRETFSQRLILLK